MILDVDGVTYAWPLPQGQDHVTAAQLKDHISERTKKSILYADKLKFATGRGDPLPDDKPVPLEPTVVKACGPASVVKMLELWCRKQEQERPEFWRERPPLERQKKPETHSGLPSVRSTRPPAHLERGPKQAMSGPGPAGPRLDSSARLVASVPARPQGAKARLGLPVAGSRPRKERDLEVEGDLEVALKQSEEELEAEEVKQLRWAIQESARLAEESALLQELEKEEGPEAGAEADEASSDEEPPPLELIPNSEE